MLHTPPTRTDWKSENLINNEYTVIDSEGSDHGKTFSAESKGIFLNETSSIEPDNNNDSNRTLNMTQEGHNINTALELEDEIFKGTQADYSHFLLESFEQPNSSNLPSELLAVYEDFLKELKEPKFERSLAVCEISDLFQLFYQTFHKAIVDFMDSKGQYELSEKGIPRTVLYYNYNLLVERLLSETFHVQIFFPSKNLPIDNLERKINDDFSTKLECLSYLDIHFKTLDIQLPDELENGLLNSLVKEILPEFELMSAERSATLKMKYLIKIHTLLGEIIKRLSNKTGGIYTLNTDIYLPLLIFSIIKLRDLSNHFLVTQLFVIKRFANEFIFTYEDDQLQEERGKLLYVCANFEAGISYISSVTLENLGLELPPSQTNLLPGSNKPRNELETLLTSSISLDIIDNEVEQFKKSNPALPNDTSNTWVDYSKLTLPDSVLHADQGLKSISNAVDSSIRNFMGKVSWLGAGPTDEVIVESDSLSVPKNEIYSDALLQQLEENVAFKGHERDVTPTSSVSSSSNDTQSRPDMTNKTPFPSTTSRSEPPHNDESMEARSMRALSTQEKLMTKFTTSVGGVMKTFRPLSTSSSTTSLNLPELSQVQPNNSNKTPGSNITSPNKVRQGPPPNNIRSRTTSFINSSLFGSPTSSSNTLNTLPHSENMTHQRTNSILGALETAISTARSRGNSIPTRAVPQDVVESEHELLKDINRLKKFDKNFDELTIVELTEMYDNYQFIMNRIARI